jgi:uncharacterized protein YndB with AHSA1/START domain
MSNNPDLTDRSAKLSVEKKMTANPDDIYIAWTEQFEQWFAAPGTLTSNVEEDGLYFFETHFENGRHPHYGRFLSLVPGNLVEQTWVTGEPGTGGAETVVRVELERVSDGTNVTLTHAGFYDEDAMLGHKEAWPVVLDLLESHLIENNV